MSVSRAQVLAHAQAAIDWLRERVTGQLHSHSARIHAGDGFIAWPGAAVDARQYVPAALAAGASACLVDAQGWEAFAFNDERVCALHDLKKHAGAIAAAVYNNPGQRIQTLAITGTNGKTSVSWWLSQALHHLGMRCAIVGTLGVGEPQWRHDCVAELEATGLTTPDPIQLQTALCTWDRAGVRACALEASSIGIVDHRLVGFPVHTAIFTNFTQDHLDYHGTMDNYWQAKRQLFDKPDLRYAIINTDDEKGRELVADLQNQRPDVSIWTYGLEALPNSILSASQHIRATELEIQSEGMRFMVGHGLAASASEWVQTELMGRYNVSNLLAVIASLTAWGYSLSEAAESAQLLRPVPGRLERVPGPDKKAPTVLVDYAHTPDALAQVLQTLQSAVEVRSGRLWCVLGCGGDRDSGKRALMGQVAQRYAQYCVVTSDNPRSENPMRIIERILSGMKPSSDVMVEADRAKAIAFAIRQAQPQDVVLLAGKGHEQYQEIAGQKFPFSDVAHAQKALQQRKANMTSQEGL